MEPVALQDYISSLDPASLPRILKICSGVYFQSSIYEISGSECCLSTGDLIKVIQINLKKVICTTPEGRITVLQPDFPGYFSLTTKPQVYVTVEKLMSAATKALPIYFSSECDIQLEDRVVPRHQPLTLMAVERYRGIHHAHCKIDTGTHKFTTYIPLSLPGSFYNWGPDFPRTLIQAIQDPVLMGQPLFCPSLHWKHLILQPEYEIDSIMHMRRNIVKIPSTLEVDVKDITASSEHLHQHFIKPLLLSEVLAQGGPFPMQVEILEVPDNPPILHRSLKKGQEITIHGPASPPWRVLASSRSRKTPRHFFISGAYKGKLRRRPQEFHTAFDLLAALEPGFPLQVVVTQDMEGEEDDSTSPSLFRGDRLEVLGRDGEVLVCNRLNDLSGEEEEEEEEEAEKKEQLLLPLYFSCGFVEEVSDGKRYNLADLMTQVSLPCEVKVLGKDPSFSEDPLFSLPGLRLEEKITEPFLVISQATDPKKYFEIPPRWLDLTVVGVKEERKGTTENQGKPLSISTVEELTDAFYYKLWTLKTCGAQAPPPRPPKNKQKLSSSDKQPTKSKELDSVQQPKCSPPQTRTLSMPQPSGTHSNLYSRDPSYCKSKKLPKKKIPEQRRIADDYEHDYESADELQRVIKKMEETIQPYYNHDYEYLDDK